MIILATAVYTFSCRPKSHHNDPPPQAPRLHRQRIQHVRCISPSEPLEQAVPCMTRSKAAFDRHQALVQSKVSLERRQLVSSHPFAKPP
ncbi:hypothetical protein CEE69_27485 [Rhodopirellula bahusiensis]|uniref:Uncharacterized protein n=1 Tax=Rhodopirellula bahusiensis TaxID=2014065 RepID=A0A2G1VZD2_9BACT|nr:hypothetical protein CEE69_27485 [Rhodopirellula bahusiensis]